MKKILFLGDSITQGACASCLENQFVELVGKKLPCQAINYGIGGTRIAKKINPIPDARHACDYLDFNTRAVHMDKDADFVFVMGGTNDHGHGDCPLGTMEDTSLYTFYGALKQLVKYLQDTYGKEKICFIMPMHKYDEDNVLGDGSRINPTVSFKYYRKAYKEVCDLYGIDLIDVDDIFPIPAKRETDVFFDGLHPNDKGHALIANKIINYLNKKLV